MQIIAADIPGRIDGNVHRRNDSERLFRVAVGQRNNAVGRPFKSLSIADVTIGERKRRSR